MIERDFLMIELPARSFDVITNISVVEHFEGQTDSSAMVASGELLKEGGTYIFSTPVNEGHYREIYLTSDVYGEKSSEGKPVFYQRHYDVSSICSRLVEPSGLVEKERAYFGDYRNLFFDKLGGSRMHQLGTLFKRFNIPKHALRHLSYSDKPISRANMKDNTESGVIVVMTRAGKLPTAGR